MVTIGLRLYSECYWEEHHMGGKKIRTEKGRGRGKLVMLSNGKRC